MNAPATCGGCGQQRAIVAQYPNMGGIFVCLDCHLRIQDGELRRRHHHAHEINGLIAQMEYMACLPPGTMPREPVPHLPPTFQDHRSMTVTNNHITVSGGTVGAINTGTIQRLNVAIDQAAQRDDAALANAIRQLGEAITNHRDLTDDQKNEAGDCLVFLVDQVAIPSAHRRPTIIRATTDALLRVLGVAADLMQVWSTVGGPIRAALGV